MKRIKTFIPFLLAVIVIGCFFSFRGADSSKIRISDKELTVAAEITDESIFVSDAGRGRMKEIASSGMLKMYLDEKTMTVCVYDVMSGNLYRSLPKKYAGEKPSALSVNVLLGGREYTLSSQSDSFSFGCTDYELTHGGVTITYSFRRSLEDKNKLDISVPVTYVLTDGMLTADIDCQKIHNKGNAVITSVTLLEYFGADSDSSEGDYILLPEGCGAIVDLGKKTDSFDEICLPVYGRDPAVYGGNDYNVPVGAFGRKYGSSAYVCLVSEGESLCEIIADKALPNEGYNRVGAKFTLTPTMQNDKYVYVSNKSYEGKFQVCYRFLNGDNADYIGMASAVRELLIRQGKLRENITTNKMDYPLTLSLVMSEDITDESSKTTVKELSSCTQVYELLDSLKSKGFGDINVRLKGFDEVDDKKQEKEHMLSLAGDGSVRFYADSSLLSYGKGNVRTLDGQKLAYSYDAEITDSLSGYISSIRKQNIYGVCINDAGELLVSDFYTGRVSLRENVKNSLCKIFASVCASKSLMVSKGNLYSIKDADCIIDLSSESALSAVDGISDVPFIQAILHGITDYSHIASNKSEDITVSLLKAVEYGALPHFEWHCTSSDEKQSEDRLYYMNSISQAKAYYDKMKSDFADIKGRRITAHKRIKEDVYLTCFGEDCNVYVNYSPEAVTVGGITVGAKSYAVVNG